MINSIISEMRSGLSQAINELYKVKIEEKDIPITLQDNPNFGDLSTVLAFNLSKVIKKSPLEIANNVKQYLKSKLEGEDVIGEINVVPPRYINFHFNEKRLSEKVLNDVLSKKDNYGGSDKYKGKKILIEHTSINPTGPINIGRARNPFIGDTLVRLHRAVGWKVLTHYYVNDMGRQSAIITWGLDKGISPDQQLIEKYKAYAHKPEFKAFFVYVPANRLIEDPDIGQMEQIKYLISRCEEQNETACSQLRDIAKNILTTTDEVETLVERCREGNENAIQKLTELCESTLGIKAEEEISTLLQKWEEGNVEAIEKLKKISNAVLDGQKETLARFNIMYDSFDFESKFVLDGSVSKVLENLKKLPQTKRLEDGAYAIDLSEFGIKKRGGGTVFQRASGTSVYVTRDVAYHYWKLKKADRAITVLGEDHKIEFQELKKLLEILGVVKFEEQLNVVHLSFVNLKGERMSTRRGITIPLDGILDEGIERALVEIKKRNPNILDKDAKKIADQIATGAIRYNVIKVQPMKKILFSWEDALNFEGESSPYIQYAHARATRILEKADLKPEEKIDLREINIQTPEEISLIKEILKFPYIVLNATENNRPHDVANYSYKLAKAFTDFYHKCPVIHERDEIKRNTKLAIVKATQQTLKNSLNLLGIEVPGVM